jgi:dihydroorotase
MCLNPAKIIGITYSGIRRGNKANITIINIKGQFKIDSSKFESKSRNTPFDGWEVKGKVEYVFKEGKIILNKGKIVSER